MGIVSRELASSTTRNFRRSFSCSREVLGRKIPKLERDLDVQDYGEPQVTKKRLYVFGCTLHGALGLTSLLRPHSALKGPKREVTRPIRHEIGGEIAIKAVAAGHGFSLIAGKGKTNSNTSLFGCGLNTHSQLGYQAARVGAPLEVLIGYVPIHMPVEKPSKILTLAAGRAHSVVALEGGQLLSFGDNSSGQCGRHVIENEAYFGSKVVQKIHNFGPSHENDIKAISARYDVTFCLTEKGEVFSFGSNFKGQLGRGLELSKNWEPAQILGDLKHQNIIKVSTSGVSTLAVNDDGELFGWGCNEAGHINPYDRRRAFSEPQFVNLKRAIGKIVDVAVGDFYSLVLNEKGNVYVTGHGSCLGLGPSIYSVKYPTLIPPTLFGRNEFNQTNKVKSIAAGYFYAAAITSDGQLYSWGENATGCLGIGSSNHQFFPFRVCIGGRVDDISIGLDHTLVLSKGGI